MLTTRTYPGTRAIGLLRTPSWPSETEATETLTQVEVGNSHHQLYSQITFRFYDIWLGLVMVFDADDAAKIGTVHCRLSWSPNGRDGWSWVDTTGSTDDGLTGPVFLPLGPPGSYDSHITFAADAPVITAHCVESAGAATSAASSARGIVPRRASCGWRRDGADDDDELRASEPAPR